MSIVNECNECNQYRIARSIAESKKELARLSSTRIYWFQEEMEIITNWERHIAAAHDREQRRIAEANQTSARADEQSFQK